jgi:putative ABC transport system permease protein
MLHRLIAYTRELVRRRRIEAEADAEVRFHLDMETEANRARGLPIDEARRAALRDFGGVTQAREGVRRVRTTWIDNIWQDVRYAARLWRRQPAFTAAALLTLAVGIGATTAIASAAYGVLLRPLPVRNEASIFIGYANYTGMGDRLALSWPAFEAWRDSRAFEDIAAVTTTREDLTDGIAERLSIQQVTSNFFRVIGVNAAVGRVFSEADDISTETPAVISDGLWRSRLSSDPAIVGKHLQAGRLAVTIVGVLPKRADRWRGSSQMWVLIEKTVAAQEMKVGYHSFTPVVRMSPGLAPAAVDRLTPITAAIDGKRVVSVRLVPLREDVSSPRLQRILLVLFTGVGLTWVVVCANLSNLLLARGPARAGELTVRLAIGASRGRIVRQLLTESAVLALPGGVLGIWLALVAIQAMASAGPVGALNPADLELSTPVLWFALVITVVSAVACGMLPALMAGRASLARGAATLEIGRASSRWSRALVIAEIAVGVVVLVAAALLIKSVERIRDVDLGFDAQKVLVFQLSLPTSTYGSTTSITDDRCLRPQRELLRRLSTLPGVEKASFGGAIFIPGASGRTSLTLESGRKILNGEPKDAPFAPGMNFIGPDYFSVHGVRVLRGREFAATDDFAAPRVVLINEAMAALHWPNEDPIGHRVNFSLSQPGRDFTEPWAEIVGVVANVRHGGVDIPAKAYIYRAAMQYPRQDFQVMLRTAVPPDALANAARAAVHAFDPTVPMFATRALSDVVDDASADVRHTSTLLLFLAGLTVVLAGLGVFSVLAYVVAARRRELAIRVALGARPAALVGSVMRQALWMLGPGVLVGLAAAIAASRSLQTLLFEVEPTDLTVFGFATVAIVAISLAAAYVPARRAATLDPVRALKE